ncbi:MAG: hypothetical protein AB1Z67_01800 [Candidatus Limnocylindrales bacterium]
MTFPDSGPILLFALAGLVGGVFLFARGLIAYRRDRLISSVATSSLDGIAAGEVRVSGVVEALNGTLISPLQSVPCVWYRAKVETTGDNSRVLMSEEQSREFRIRDENGAIRVVPRGARWEIGAVFDERTSWTGAEPPGLNRRSGARYLLAEREVDHMSELEREAAAQALLTVKRPVAATPADDWDQGGGSFFAAKQTEGRRYREARLEPGQTVTIVGQAWPWGEVQEVVLAWNPSDNVERDIAGDIAWARELGVLAASPEEAWGNAAIPGFGIGAPTARPELHPEAREPEVPEDPSVHEDALAKYDIPDEELVLSRGLRGGMAVYLGSPEAATQHHDAAFLLGVIGAVMAALSAFGLGALLTGTL